MKRFVLNVKLVINKVMELAIVRTDTRMMTKVLAKKIAISYVILVMKNTNVLHAILNQEEYWSMENASAWMEKRKVDFIAKVLY